jgi:predicted porin
MDKRVLAIAVASVCGAPVVAHAQAGTVQVFGRLYTELSNISTGRYNNGTHVNPDILQTPGSEIGFKGEEPLGGGLAAWFQCASTADTRAESTGGFCSRNSAVGLKGAFGNLWLGNWDTPYKRVFLTNRILNTTGAFGMTVLLTGGSTTTRGAANPAEFSRRQSDSINYDSPDFGGFQLMVSTNTSTPSSNQTSGNATAKPRLWSLGGTYTNGPLNLGIGYEQHKDFNPAGPSAVVPANGFSGTDKGYLLSAGYVRGPVKLGAIWTRRDFEPAAGRDLRVDAWQVAADWTVSGPHGLRVGYTRANDTKGSYAVSQANGPNGIQGNNSQLVANGGAGNTGARMWQAHYVHTFSKRTVGTFGYARVDNDSAAGYTLFPVYATPSGAPGSPGVSAGNDQHVWGVSLAHRF